MSESFIAYRDAHLSATTNYNIQRKLRQLERSKSTRTLNGARNRINDLLLISTIAMARLALLASAHFLKIRSVVLAEPPNAPNRA